MTGRPTIEGIAAAADAVRTESARGTTDPGELAAIVGACTLVEFALNELHRIADALETIAAAKS